tara:strand:- start:3625 stop:5532 length:1908 start_codon:yes stop_codon:yes gene_type:complete
MNRLTHGLLALLLAAPTLAAEPTIDDAALLEAYVDGIVMPLMKDNNSPAGTVAIVQGGELLLAKGYGFEDIEEQIPVDANETLFRPGSTSKLFTWVSVMQLVEQGKLDLDTDVNTYLEDFQIQDTFEEPITLRHILTHTPGFEDGGLGYLIVDDPELIEPLSVTMEKFQPERINPPGTYTAYSNYATSLAGLIVEIVSGVPFNDYVKQNILDPLGMTRSSFEEPLPDALEQRMAGSYKAEAGAYVEKDFEIIANFAPAGAMSATSTDMVRFGQAILNGGELDGVRILKEATVEEMLTPNFTHDERTTAMLLGFYETDLNGHRVVGHGGDTIYFHSYLGIDAEAELVFFVSFAANGGSPTRSAFAPALYNEFFPRNEAPPVPPEDFAERSGRYAGSYGFWRGNFSKIERAFSLGSAVQVAPTGDNTLMVAFGGGAKQYVEVEKNLFRELDPNISLVAGISPRLIAFQENDEGAITGFVLDGLPFMATRKMSFFETANFNFTLLGLSFVIFLAVILRRWYQRRELAALPAADKSAFNAAFYTSLIHVLTLIIGGIVVSIAAKNLINGFPPMFKIWLIMPILSTLASVYLLARTFGVWNNKLLTGIWARIRYTFVALAGLFIAWFYYYWNILGFQYMV